MTNRRSPGRWVAVKAPPLLRDTVRAGRPSTVAQRAAGALPTVLQCGLASAVAWWVAEALLGHVQPVFAATSAVVCLAAGTGGRAQQAIDLLAGVLVGVLVGQVVRVVQAEPGTMTTLVAVTAALLAASLLDTRTLALIQAGASALFVLTLPPVEAPFVRFLDAAVGGALGLLASQVLITPDPVRLVRGPACAVLADVAAALRAANPDQARQHARRAVVGLGDLATARSTARAIAARTVRGRLRADRLACLNRDLADVDILGAAALLHVRGRRGLLPGLADDVAAAADALGDPGGRAGEVLRRVIAALTGPDGSVRQIPG